MTRPGDRSFGVQGKKKTYMAKGKIHYQLFLSHQKHVMYSRSPSGDHTHRFLTLWK